jgi:hypothetical protein
MTQDEAFKKWWYNEGSQAPYTHHDCEEHTMRMCEIAWANGAFVEREACAKLVDDNAKACTNNSMAQMVLYSNATAIRARGEA